MPGEVVVMGNRAARDRSVPMFVQAFGLAARRMLDSVASAKPKTTATKTKKKRKHLQQTHKTQTKAFL